MKVKGKGITLQIGEYSGGMSMMRRVTTSVYPKLISLKSA
jgi:hypothetical protein